MIFNLHSLITSKIIIEVKSKINQLIFQKGIASGGAVYINSIQVQQLIFEDFANEGVLEITGVTSKTYQVPSVPFRYIERSIPIHLLLNRKLVFLRSNLDNAVFKGVDFESFDQIVISDSKLNNISTVNSHLPVGGGEVRSQLEEDNNTLLQKASEMAEIYNQLYLAMQKQGNRKWELAYYGAYLDWESKATKHWLSKIPLILHHQSTRYGSQWYRALGWIIGLSLILYFAYSISLGGITFGLRYLSWKSIWFHLNHYFQFLYPVRKISFIQNTQLTPLATFIDIFWRIVFSYLLYQMVVAFRRLGRK